MRFTDGQQVLEVERAHWTDHDYSVLGWHDCRVHALAFSASETEDPFGSSLLLDLDYILRWVHPGDSEQAFRFWIAPATLRFKNAHHPRGTLSAELEPFELDGITRAVVRHVDGHELDGLWDWTIEGHDFSLDVRATGFDQYLRAAPVLSGRQFLTTRERAGLSFATVPAW